MSQVTYFRLLERESDRFTHTTIARRRAVIGDEFCTRCHRPHRSLFPRPIDVQLRSLHRHMSIGGVDSAALGWIHVDLLEILLPHMGEFAFGKVFDASGQELPKLRTFYARTYVRPRGDHRSTATICPLCGTVMYDWDGAPYILARHAKGRELLADSINTLYVSQAVHDQIDWRRFRDIKPYPFPVREEPIDGLDLPDPPS